MHNQPPQLNPAFNFILGAFGIVTIAMAVIFIAPIALFSTLVGVGLTASYVQDQSYTEVAQAVVTSVSSEDTFEDGRLYCKPSYSYTVKGQNYTGTSGSNTPEHCSLTTGSTIPVRYNPTKPAQSSPGTPVSLVAVLVTLVAALISSGVLLSIIAFIVRARRRSDKNNDGFSGDDMPATSGQIAIIQNGMRELGEFWTPPREMTQNEARETIAALQLKLVEQNKTLPPA